MQNDKARGTRNQAHEFHHLSRNSPSFYHCWGVLWLAETQGSLGGTNTLKNCNYAFAADRPQTHVALIDCNANLSGQSAATDFHHLNSVENYAHACCDYFNSVQTGCIVKGDAQKSPFSDDILGGGRGSSQVHLLSMNSTAGPFKFTKITDFCKCPCRSTCLHNAPS